jgi:hypothetical protein
MKGPAVWRQRPAGNTAFSATAYIKVHLTPCARENKVSVGRALAREVSSAVPPRDSHLFPNPQKNSTFRLFIFIRTSINRNIKFLYDSQPNVDY